jgi:hypothetical protein
MNGEITMSRIFFVGSLALLAWAGVARASFCTISSSQGELGKIDFGGETGTADFIVDGRQLRFMSEVREIDDALPKYSLSISEVTDDMPELLATAVGNLDPKFPRAVISWALPTKGGKDTKVRMSCYGLDNATAAVPTDRGELNCHVKAEFADMTVEKNYPWGTEAFARSFRHGGDEYTVYATHSTSSDGLDFYGLELGLRSPKLGNGTLILNSGLAAAVRNGSYTWSPSADKKDVGLPWQFSVDCRAR